LLFRLRLAGSRKSQTPKPLPVWELQGLAPTLSCFHHQPHLPASPSSSSSTLHATPPVQSRFSIWCSQYNMDISS